MDKVCKSYVVLRVRCFFEVIFHILSLIPGLGHVIFCSLFFSKIIREPSSLFYHAISKYVKWARNGYRMQKLWCNEVSKSSMDY
jgi:hypothetical protein